MSSIEINSNKTPPSKPLSRKLSKPDSVTYSDSVDTNGSILNSVRGSIRRFRRTSGATTALNSKPDPLSSNTHIPTFSRFQSTIANIAREQTSRLKDINISQKTADLTAIVQEMGTELGKKGVEFGSMTKDAVDKWKKRKDFPSSNFLESSKNVTGVKIFGAPLKTAVISTRIEKDIEQIQKDTSRYWLPTVIVRCIEFLDKYGLDEIGIYRIPGSVLTVSRIRSIFDYGADLNFLQSSTEDPHAVATLLKMYFRELPEPILTEVLLPDFNECVAKHTNSAGVATQPILASGSQQFSTAYFTAPTKVPTDLPRDLTKIVSRLPPYNFYLLRALCEHLSRVDGKSGINKMNISNLGLIFCPNLGIGSILFKTFVGYIDIVFGEGCIQEAAELENEKREQDAKEKHASLIYHKTCISDDFSKSLEDLLTLNKKTQTNSSSQFPSSSSSPTKGYNLDKDNIGNPNTVMAISSSTLSESESKYKNLDNQQQTYNETTFLSLNLLANNHEQHQPYPINITNVSTLSPNVPFRKRSYSTGLPLTIMEFSSDSSESDDESKNFSDETGLTDSPNSPTLMTFDYFDKHGTKNLGVLNLSRRVSNKWVVNHNAVEGDRTNSSVASIRRRRRDTDSNKPSNLLEENVMTEKNESNINISGDVKTIINKINSGISDSLSTSNLRGKTKKYSSVGNLINP
ncbi:649_t:CDS:2 [Diversispora eburnea]|uniref:649_t:CDS:1 n=1 Tax=Diversispora eburnea TaxID=1213867 RepID=A0A9N9EWM6_9GLOM|nr:649_t:CDS:2 [Diversispora eburnea]